MPQTHNLGGWSSFLNFLDLYPHSTLILSHPSRVHVYRQSTSEHVTTHRLTFRCSSHRTRPRREELGASPSDAGRQTHRGPARWRYCWVIHTFSIPLQVYIKYKSLFHFDESRTCTIRHWTVSSRSSKESKARVPVCISQISKLISKAVLVRLKEREKRKRRVSGISDIYRFESSKIRITNKGFVLNRYGRPHVCFHIRNILGMQRF